MGEGTRWWRGQGTIVDHIYTHTLPLQLFTYKYQNTHIFYHTFPGIIKPCAVMDKITHHYTNTHIKHTSNTNLPKHHFYAKIFFIFPQYVKYLTFLLFLSPRPRSHSALPSPPSHTPCPPSPSPPLPHTHPPLTLLTAWMSAPRSTKARAVAVRPFTHAVMRAVVPYYTHTYTHIHT